MLIMAEGKTIYHAGDTALTLEMQLLGQRNKIELALLPIGDNFTMGPEDAVTAAEFLKAGLVMPIHYNTFGYIRQDPEKYVEMLGAKGIRGHAMAIGGILEVAAPPPNPGPLPALAVPAALDVQLRQRFLQRSLHGGHFFVAR